ncbi:hypothetical protein [Streptomyces sp. NPDC059491]
MHRRPGPYSYRTLTAPVDIRAVTDLRVSLRGAVRPARLEFSGRAGVGT